MDLLELLRNTKGGGSGTGISYYSTRCARKARLDKEAQAAGESESSFNATVGTIFHKLEELWYTGELEGIALPIDDEADCNTDPVQEALRVFAGYLKVFPKDEFTTVGCEVLLPQNATQKSLIEVAVGVTPFTLRVDRVIHVNEEQAVLARERRRVDLEPGYYLVDTKTSEKKDTSAEVKYALSLQFPSYMVAWNAAFPDKQVKGMLVNNVVRHADLTKKEPDGGWRSFRTYFVPPPTPMQTEALRTYLKYKEVYLKTDQCELMACSDWGGCGHYSNGNCNRI